MWFAPPRNGHDWVAVGHGKRWIEFLFQPLPPGVGRTPSILSGCHVVISTALGRIAANPLFPPRPPGLCAVAEQISTWKAACIAANASAPWQAHAASAVERGQEARPGIESGAATKREGAGRNGGVAGAAKKKSKRSGEQRGGLTSVPDRLLCVELIREAVKAGFLGIFRRWHIRDQVPLRQIARRLGISRNAVQRYLRSETIEPAYAATGAMKGAWHHFM